MAGQYDLYDRRFELSVSDGQEEKTFAGGEKDGLWQGLDITFKVTKTGDAAPNEAEIELINVNPDHRAWLSRQNLVCTLKAGYRNGFGQIFIGSLETCGHEQQDQNWVTKLFCKDGGAALRDLTVFKTWKKGTAITTVIGDILKKLTGKPDGLDAQFQTINQLAQGQIDMDAYKARKPRNKRRKRSRRQADPTFSQYATKKQNNREKAHATALKRAETLAGAAVKKLQSLCTRMGLVLLITDHTIHIFPKGLSLEDDEIDLSQEAGLIGSPEKTADGAHQGGYETVSLLRFEFNPGRPVFLDSLYVSESQIIWRTEHTGAIPGEWRTKIFTEKLEDG